MTRRILRTLAAGAVLSSLAACGTDPVYVPRPERDRSDRPDADALGLPADPLVLLEPGARPGEVTQRGSLDVDIGLVVLDGGRVEVAAGREDRAAFRFPPFVADPSEPYPRAVLEVRSDAPGDPMSPGPRDFAWGADFRLDEESFGISADNGDNVIQRGLSSHPTMFKAEVDGDRAACTVQGSDGLQIIRASEQVRPGWWYRVRCRRTGDELAVLVTEYQPSGRVRTYASRVEGPIGDVTMQTPDTPLTIGGKVGMDGEILQDASDQFNGLVMNPVLAIGD